MRPLGLIGGITWHSTVPYYVRINEGIARELGPFRSADLRLHSIDYGLVRAARATHDWKPLRRELVRAARGLQKSGARGLVVCSNSMHQLAGVLASQVSIPLLHIADAVADRASADGHTRVGLLGTAFTMTQPFYADRLRARGLEVCIPDGATVEALDHILLEEMAAGALDARARDRFVEAIEDLRTRGATAVLLSCTEIGLLVRPQDSPLPLIDSVVAHADAAVRFMVDMPSERSPSG